MGRHGVELFSSGSRILTHCNTGALATGGDGPALAVIRAVWSSGRLSMVYADETRPFLQGSRLTAWELHRDGIPTRVITDGMAAWFMKQGMVDAVIVGTDRVAANGDVANKIGTYGLAVSCRAHGLPFYVAGPTSTIDLETATGDSICIERRPDREVTHVGDVRIVPEGVEVENPAFDVTPAELVSAIVTERGVIRPPFASGLQKHVEEAALHRI
jgi:methylthioribose-1-phosphate isomerase